MKIVIDYHRYGERQEFASIGEAQKVIRASDPDLEDETLTVLSGGMIENGDGLGVGQVEE